MSDSEQRVDFTSGELRLEGRLTDGAGMAAVVLHPHPQYGGDMDNVVVMALRDVFADRGASVLRFNFRGAGRSDGAYDGGAGEADDALAAIAFLRERAGGVPLVLCGYSFGAVIASRIAGEASLAGLVLVSPPLGMMTVPAFDASLPVLFVTGDRDQIAPAVKVLPLDDGSEHRAAIVAGADHSWWGRTDALVAEVASFLDRLNARS